MPINKLISTPCPECRVTLTNTGRCFNLTCRFAGMQVVPLSRAKAVESRNAQEPSNEPYDPEIPVTRSLLEAACNELLLWKVKRGGDDQVYLNLQATIDRFNRGTMFEETNDKPIETLQIRSVCRDYEYDDHSLTLTLNRRPTDREIELIHWLGNLLLTAYDHAKDSDNAS
jgi:hypothetical protein